MMMMMILLCHTSDPRLLSLRVHKRMSRCIPGATKDVSLELLVMAATLRPEGKGHGCPANQSAPRPSLVGNVRFGGLDGANGSLDDVEISTCTALIHKNGTTRDAMRPAHRSFLFLFTIDHKADASMCVCVLSNRQKECWPGAIHPKQDGRTEHRIRQDRHAMNELHKANSSGARLTCLTTGTHTKPAYA
jgi:hypothetical protein